MPIYLQTLRNLLESTRISGYSPNTREIRVAHSLESHAHLRSIPTLQGKVQLLSLQRPLFSFSAGGAFLFLRATVLHIKLQKSRRQGPQPAENCGLAFADCVSKPGGRHGWPVWCPFEPSSNNSITTRMRTMTRTRTLSTQPEQDDHNDSNIGRTRTITIARTIAVGITRGCPSTKPTDTTGNQLKWHQIFVRQPHVGLV